MILIGISGRAGSGKDEVTKHLRVRFPSSERMAFADPLKDEVCSALRIKRDELESHKTLYRPLLQWWGTEYRRTLSGDDYWIKQWMKQVLKFEGELVVVPDVRFENEAQMISDCGGFLWRVVRTERTSCPEHRSETELDGYTKFDFTIINDRNISWLQQQVDMGLEMLGIAPTNNK